MNQLAGGDGELRGRPAMRPGCKTERVTGLFLMNLFAKRNSSFAGLLQKTCRKTVRIDQAQTPGP